MLRHLSVFVFAITLLSTSTRAQSVPATTVPSDAEIHTII